MKKTLLIAKNELVNTVLRPSFLIMLFALPLFMIVVMWISMGGIENPGNPAMQILMGDMTKSVEGIVDQSGIVRTIPAADAEAFRLYPDEQAAQTAVASGEISSYFVIQPDYLTSGRVLNYRPDFNPLGGTTNSAALKKLIAVNLLPDQPDLVNRSVDLINRTRETIDQATTVDRGSFLAFILPYIVTLLLYSTIFGSSQYMLNSVTTEKQNRVIEILATSVSPTQLMIGKITALGLAGLLQSVIWFGTAFAVYRYFGSTGLDFSGVNLAPGFFAGLLFYFAAGYLLYASLMDAVGALVSNVKEASQVTFVIIIPLIIPLMFTNEIGTNPDGFFTLLLSLFPLTSPVTMPSRMVISQVPIWQIAASAGLLLLTVWLLFKAAAGIFRAQNLLTGQALTAKSLFLAIIGRR